MEGGVKIYNLKAKPDVHEIASLIREVGSIKVEQVKSLLKHRGKTEPSIDEVLTILTNQRFAFWDESMEYLLSNPMIKREQTEFSHGRELALWLYISLYEKVEIPLFNCKYPSVFGYIYSRGAMAADVLREDAICHVFYVPEGREGFYSSLISSTYAVKMDEAIDIVVIIDSLSSIPNFRLSESFNIIAYAIIDSQIGTVQLYK